MTPRIRIDTIRGPAARVINRAADMRRGVPVVRPATMAPLGALLFDIGGIASRYLPPLVLLLASLECAMIAGPAFISAMYPIELEPREGARWLHALALNH